MGTCGGAIWEARSIIVGGDEAPGYIMMDDATTSHKGRFTYIICQLQKGVQQMLTIADEVGRESRTP